MNIKEENDVIFNRFDLKVDCFMFVQLKCMLSLKYINKLLYINKVL